MRLIDLDDAIEAIASRDETDGTVKVFTGREINKILFDLPSAELERSKGEWIKKISKRKKDKEYIGYTPYWYCSECGKRYEPALANTIINYCYNCGADMREDT